jgi:hypothetical protein
MTIDSLLIKRLLICFFSASAEAGKISGQSIVPNMGAGAAGGSAAAAIIKATTSMPMAQRVALTAVTAGTTGLATKVGIETGAPIVKNLDLTSAIKSSKLADLKKTGNTPPSSTDSSNDYVLSVLEDEKIPLIDLLNN